jgi:hypothetical protein
MSDTQSHADQTSERDELLSLPLVDAKAIFDLAYATALSTRASANGEGDSLREAEQVAEESRQDLVRSLHRMMVRQYTELVRQSETLREVQKELRAIKCKLDGASPTHLPAESDSDITIDSETESCAAAWIEDLRRRVHEAIAAEWRGKDSGERSHQLAAAVRAMTKDFEG